MPITTEAAVEQILTARAERRPLPPFSAMPGGLGMDHAYAIQDALAAELRRQGQPPAGWKLAATGPTGQAVLGVKDPVYGPLRSVVFASSAMVAKSGFVDVGVEAEIAFRMGTDLAGPGITPDQAMRAVACLLPALELPDLIFTAPFQATDIIADCAASAAIVLGAPFVPPPGFDLAAEQVTFWRDATLLGTNTADELMGHPMHALAWLANQLGARGKTLKAGDIVMSGGLSSFIRPQAGEKITARFSRIGEVGAVFQA